MWYGALRCAGVTLASNDAASKEMKRRLDAADRAHDCRTYIKAPLENLGKV